MPALDNPVITRDYRGMATVAGTPMRVADLARAHDERGLSVEQLHEKIQFLTVEQIQAALDYYHKHGDPCEAKIRAEQDRANKEWLDEQFKAKGNWLPKVWGKWPGDESDEEINAALEELS